MKKGLSPIISAILILLIAISVTLLATIWLPKFIINIFPQLGFNESYVRSRGCLSIENVDGLFGLFTVKNCGKVSLSDFSFFIDNSFVNKLNIGTLEPSQSIDFYDMPIAGGRHSLYITADYAESPPYVLDVPYWECIGGKPDLIIDWYVSKTMSCICSYNTEIPLNGQLFVIGNGSLSLYNCILWLGGSTKQVHIRDNGFFNFTRSIITALGGGSTTFEGNSTIYLLNSTLSDASPTIQDQTNVTAINSNLGSPAIRSNIPHRLSVSNINGKPAGSPITSYFKADNSNFTVNFTNVSFYYISFSISDNSNTTISNSFFEPFSIHSENPHNLTISNFSWFSSNFSDHFKAQGSNFELRGINLDPSESRLYMDGGSNNTVINSSIAELRISDGHNSTNNFINFNSYGNWYLYGKYFTMNFTNTIISGAHQISIGEGGPCISIWNFSNTTIYDNREWDFATANVTFFGNITYLGSPYIGSFSNSNVTRYFPTVIKDSNNIVIPTAQPAVINITNYLNQSIWLGNVSGGSIGTYYTEDPNIIFNRSNYGLGNFTMKVSQICENKTNITLLSNTSLEFTINRSYNYDGTSFSTPQVGGTRRGMDFDNSNFWVSSSNGNVSKYTSTGTYVSPFNSTLKGLIDVASNVTYLWLLNYNSTEKRVYRYLPSGTYDNWNFSISEVLEPYAVDFDGESFWVLGNTSVYKYNITGGYTGFSFVLNRLPGVYYGDIVSSSGNIWILTENYSSSNGRGVFRYKNNGTYDNWYFDIAPTTLTGRGLAFNGTYFWVMDSSGNIFRYGLNRNCLDFMKNCDEFITLLPYTISKNNTRYCLLYSLYASSQTAITFANSIQNSSLDCQWYNIGGNGATSTVGVNLTGANNNTINNCNLTGFNNGINIFSSSNNTITNTNSNSNGAGIVVTSSSNNTITNCSINGNINNDYYLANLGMNNNFINTNFTASRTIYFFDSTSWFNYANNSMSPFTLGNANIGSSWTGAGGTFVFFGSKFTLTGPVTVSKISAYLHTATGSDAAAAIYSDSSGSPNALLAQSNSIILSGSDSWNNFTLNADLLPGDYWLIIRCANCYFRYDNGGTNQWASKSAPSFPNPFGSVGSWQNWSMSIFATSMQNIWLKTSVSAQSTITRKLVNLNNTMMKWNDTFSNTSGSITARYNVTNLVAGAPYSVYDNSVELVNSPIKTDSSGTLSFTINLLAGQEHSIIVKAICDYYVFSSSIPFTITQNNSYYCLVENVLSSSASTAINFSSSVQNSTLDCANNVIGGTGATNSYGVFSGANNSNIRNCNITKWYYGFYALNSSYDTLYNNSIVGNIYYNAYFDSNSNNANITNNNISSAAAYFGLVINNNNFVINNTVNNNPLWGIDLGLNNTLINNTVVYNGLYGIYVRSSNNTLINNTIFSYHISSSRQQGLFIIGGRLKNNISETNTINGLPILFIDGKARPCVNNTVYTNGSSYSYMGFIGCSNITVRDSSPTDSIYFSSMTNSAIYNLNINFTQYAIQIESELGTNTNVTSNTINGAGTYSIYDHFASGSILSNNTINCYGGGIGFMIYGGGSDILTNNIVTNCSNGFLIVSAFSNNITGGWTYNNANDYSVNGAGTSNNFTNTNFTAARTIYFGDSTSWFNYQNDSSQSIWLKTNVSAAATITRKLVNWNQSIMQWNDTFTNISGSITARYNVSGLLPSTCYNVYSNSALTYNLYSDPNGQISFTLNMLASQSRNITLNNVSCNVLNLNFNENTGTTAHDSSVYGNNGTLYNGAVVCSNPPTAGCPSWVPGVYGSALSFDGANDYVNVPDSNSLDVVSAITVSAWIYPTSLPSTYPRIVSKEVSTTADPYSLELDGSNNCVLFCLDTGSGEKCSDSGISSITLNQLYYATGVWDGTNNKIYLNGTLKGTRSQSGYLAKTANNVLIGNNPTGIKQFNGTIDEVRIWSRALNSTEIQAEMNKG